MLVRSLLRTRSNRPSATSRKFARDSPLEEDRFEASIPARAASPRGAGRSHRHGSCRLELNVLRLRGADEQHELRVSNAIVAEIVRPAGWVEDHVMWAESLFDRMPGLLPADSDAALQNQIRVLGCA